MTPKQIAAIQRTADVLLAVGSRVVEAFYARLFEIAPEVRPLFPIDMRVQTKKLADTLAVLVDHLVSEGAFAGYLAQLGRHHAGLGVKADQYGAVAAALLYSLDEALGDRFDDEVRDAWTALYVEIQTAMLAGARPDAAAQGLQ